MRTPEPYYHNRKNNEIDRSFKNDNVHNMSDSEFIDWVRSMEKNDEVLIEESWWEIRVRRELDFRLLLKR